MNRSCLFCSLLLFLCAFVPTYVFAIDGFPGATWGELRWEIPTKGGEEDAILQGWIRQGVDLKRWSPSTHLYAYGTVRYSWDSKENSWWNDVAPGAGIALDTPLAKQFPITFGVEYVWDRFFVSPHTEQKVILYMNWFGWWDLGKKP